MFYGHWWVVVWWFVLSPVIYIDEITLCNTLKVQACPDNAFSILWFRSRSGWWTRVTTCPKPKQARNHRLPNKSYWYTPTTTFTDVLALNSELSFTSHRVKHHHVSFHILSPSLSGRFLHTTFAAGAMVVAFGAGRSWWKLWVRPRQAWNQHFVRNCCICVCRLLV